METYWVAPVVLICGRGRDVSRRDAEIRCEETIRAAAVVSRRLRPAGGAASCPIETLTSRR